ncbi:putative Zn-dependent protease-like protein [Hyella patelloides LEGE 07179]|uniref:Putative Zn-dependent protease-like protein n=1 Tax=Hyella patelloides LEGE 07179 TaxID=945734 RepID=A0A563VMK1_9CYAN|nr:putative Zn-dependent protease-like protein [Hyella patelloides LEGE 07179]
MLVTTDKIITEALALEIIENAIAESQAEGVFVSLNSSESVLSRFSENQISQNIHKNRFNLTVTSYFGQKSASASTTELDREAIIATMRRAEELAKFAPEDPEWIELLPSQSYEERKPAFDSALIDFSPLDRGEIVQQVCSQAQKSGVEGSGTLSSSISLMAIGNSVGLKAAQQGTDADFSFTARQENGSSWSQLTAWDMASLPILETTKKTIKKAIASRNPQAISPGDYTVIFEPQAMASLLPWVIWNMDARAADEGRSFMSRNDDNGNISNRVGEQLFNSLVQVQRNPAHSLLQSGVFFGNGLPNSYLDIVKDGTPQTLSYSRYWAQQKSKQPTGGMYPIVMTGGNQTTEELIASTEKGILVTRAWYVRYVNPRTLEVTGMTRDGTFLIENGKIAYPIQNLRFNQSLPEMLKNISALGKVKRCGRGVIPTCKVENFHFSSVTDSV